MKNLGQQIRKFREQNGITLNAYAQKLGVSPGYLSNLENGKTETIQLSLLEFLANELNIHWTTLNEIKTHEEIDFRIQKIGHLLKMLQKKNPTSVEYLLKTLEQGIEFFNKNS